MDNKLLVGLISIGAQQAAATQNTNESINQLLNYSATYPTDGILYRSIDIVICDHSDAGFHNESKGRIRAGAYMFLFKNDHMTNLDGPVLTLSLIIKIFMSSASESELGALFVTAQEILSTRNILEKMRWPQPKSPLQTDNSAAAGVFNNEIVPRKLKAMDRRLHWMRCREAQGQFR